MTKKKKILLSIVVCFLLSIGGGAYYFATNYKTLLYPTLIPPAWEFPWSPKVAKIDIAGRHFEIPIKYVQSYGTGNTGTQSALLLYMLPDYRAKSDFTTERDWLVEFRLRQGSSMLVEDASVRPPIDVMIQNRKRTVIVEFRENEGFDILEHQDWYRMVKGVKTQSDEIYLEHAPDGKILSFIDCHVYREGTFPQCSHKFIDKGVLYHISYNKERYLKDWNARRDSAIQFFESFEKEATR
ncbi:MAG: hypothetical protein MI976_28155 [Pseudomonadales bacterium]|nr:hypothetical protein [Pseudomonadales bacterium]